MAAAMSNPPEVLGEHEADLNQRIQFYISARVQEFRRLDELRKKVRLEQERRLGHLWVSESQLTH